MFTVDCSDYEQTTNDGIPNGVCSSSASNSYEYGNDGVKIYGCYDEYNTEHCEWNDGHCCDDYDSDFNINKTTSCNNCLCLDPAFTTIPGTYVHQRQRLLTSNYKSKFFILKF